MVMQDITAFQRSEPSPVFRFSDYIGSSTTRVRVQTTATAWTNIVGKRLDQLCALKPGWDGYDCKPVSFTIATFAARLMERIFVEGLTAPSLVPGGDGTLQMEWHVNGYDLEIDVLGPNNVFAYRRDHEAGHEEERQYENDFTELLIWTRDLATPRAEFAAASS